MSAEGNPTEEEREHVTEDQLGGEGATAHERDLRDLWEHAMRCGALNVADGCAIVSCALLEDRRSVAMRRPPRVVDFVHQYSWLASAFQ